MEKEAYKKYLVNIEFRYKEVVEYPFSGYTSKKITIGVYNSIEEAIEAGNNVLILLENKFPLNKHYNRKERFGKKTDEWLICNGTHLITPFQYFARIKQLYYYDNLDNIIDAVLQSEMEYRQKQKEEENDSYD